MADIALKTANRIEVVESLEQHTSVAAEAVTAGAPVRIDTTTGRFTNANGSAADEARAYGIATKTVAAGQSLTAIRRGVLGGFDFDSGPTAFDAAIYLSDTDGRIADAAGTVSVVVGRVLPVFGDILGQGASRVLLVNMTS